MDIERLKKAGEIMHKLLDIPFAIYDGARPIFWVPQERQSASLIISRVEPLLALDFDRQLMGSPQHESNQFGESFIIFNREAGQCLLLGPYSQERLKDNRLKRLIGKMIKQSELSRHLKHLPYLPAEKAFHIGEMMSLMFYADREKIEEGQPESKLIRDAMSFIELNLEDRLSASLIAQKLEVHPDYLSSRFKKETGMAMMVYIQKQRALLACRMLKSSARSVADIAQSLQFSSASRFTDVFKRHIGISPLAYRDRG